MFSFLKRKRTLTSLIASSIYNEYKIENFLTKFRINEESDWHDFEESGKNHSEFSVELFFITALKIFKSLTNDKNVSETLNQGEGEEIFLECIAFICFAIPKLDYEEYLVDLYGRTGDFYKLDGSDVVLNKIIDLYSHTKKLSSIHPQKLVDFWEDRSEFYFQLGVLRPFQRKVQSGSVSLIPQGIRSPP
ncbi:hypothetical protein, partial [uncultured Shewanella sp.]|uniref:hypothetical protein n=1 Tax=uncultured Shewanella sp. TaxID=173975 RepID=UPI00261E82F6